MTFLRIFLAVLVLVFAQGSWGGDVLEFENGEPNIDPWEPMNRKFFAFNEGLDDYVLRPLAKGYAYVTPDPVEEGVTNFVDNIYEFNNITNALLQGRFANSFDSFGRLVINSTVGVIGFFDVASAMGVPHSTADFGQTLYIWGVDPGPFLMVPVVGPRTVRGGFGQVFDSYASIPGIWGDSADAIAFSVVDTVDARVQLLKADQLISGDPYLFLRNAYLQRREVFLTGGIVEDDFSDFEEGEDFEDF
jgi:phospholipid-binding lipoprotein MlaA